MKPNLKSLLKARRFDLSKADPKSRDRIRCKVKVLEMTAQIKRECRNVAA